MEGGVCCAATTHTLLLCCLGCDVLMLLIELNEREEPAQASGGRKEWSRDVTCSVCRNVAIATGREDASDFLNSQCNSTFATRIDVVPLRNGS